MSNFTNEECKNHFYSKSESIDDNHFDDNICKLPSVYQERYVGKPGREARCCSFSLCGSLFAWSIGQGFIKILNLKYDNYQHGDNIIASHEQCKVIACGEVVMAMKFAPNYTQLNRKQILIATGLDSGQVIIWNALSGEMAYNLSDHRGSVKGLSFAHNLPILVSCSLDKTLKIWDLEDGGNMSHTIKGSKFSIFDCQFSPVNFHILAFVGMGKMVNICRLIDKRHSSLSKQLDGHMNDVTSCSWSPDGALLATASHDTTVIVWDPVLENKICVLCHMYPFPCPIYAGGSNGAWISSVSFSGDGSKIATVCEDNRLRVWNLCDEEHTVKEYSLEESGFQCAFSHDGRIIAVGKKDGSVTLISSSSNKVLSLQHLSRLAARKYLSSNHVDKIFVPPAFRDFLLYQTHVL